MLAKCLKYDLKAVFSVWWIAALTLLGLSFPAGYCARVIVTTVKQTPFLAYFGVGIYKFATATFVITTLILVFVRYYQNFFQDEGYLTFTLPVRRETLFWSKVLCGVISVFAALAVIAASDAIAMAMIPGDARDEIGGLFSVLGVLPAVEDIHLLGVNFSNLGIWGYIYAGEILLGLSLYGFSGLLAVYLCITLGAVVAKKHKILAAVGFGYAFNTAMSIAGKIVMVIVAMFGFSLSEAVPGLFESPENYAFLALCGLLICIVLAVINTILAFANIGCLERKLNLS